MTGTIADSSTCRLARVPSGGPLSGHCVGVPAAAGASDQGGACLMTVRDGQDVIQIAVHAMPLREVPRNVVAVGDDLAAEWDADLERAQWTLESVNAVPVRALTLELPTEARDPVTAAREIAAAGLAGELLWIPSDGAEMSLTVGNLPHRIRSIEAGRTGTVAEITRDTQVEIYAPAVRAGVDIVILADCSGSMGVDDLPVDVESRWNLPAGTGWVTRMQALQRALGDLLDMRLQISGRVSRLALLEFNREARQRFPRSGGMTQLDGSSPAQDVDEFRNGVALLRASGGTDIGNALHEAANLLYRYGRAGNEKLIVLVSDGADWKPKGEEGSGEMVYAVTEPVSLMAHLHRDVGIRLHALGISTDELYRRRGYAPKEGLVPNHELLRELVKVGGGDPTTIGGLDVLEDYFSGLGTGVTHRVRERLADRRTSGVLSPEAVAKLARFAKDARHNDWDARCAELSDQVGEEVGHCHAEGVRVFGGPIWEEGRAYALCAAMRQMAADEAGLIRVLERITNTLKPRPPGGGLGDIADQLCQTLDRLSAVAGQGSEVVVSYRRQFEFGSDHVGAVQADAIRRVHDGLAAMHSSLRNRPDHAGQGEPDQNRRDGTASFVYRD